MKIVLIILALFCITGSSVFPISLFRINWASITVPTSWAEGWMRSICVPKSQIYTCLAICLFGNENFMPGI